MDQSPKTSSYEAPYGTWKSPISSQLATQSATSFDGLHVDKIHGCTVYWKELRIEEGGRNVICSKSGSGNIEVWTPPEYNVRTLIHEYGGGSFSVHNGVVYFSNFDDQRLYRQMSASDKPEPITPDKLGYRYADYCISEKLQRLYSVREDHGMVERGERTEAHNTIVVINPATQQQTVLAEGCDFYSSPRVSPDGKYLVWVQWNHPNMPWDSTELWQAELSESGDAVVPDSAKQVAGGADVSLMYPDWLLDNTLLYISDVTEWWNLYHVLPSGEHVNVYPQAQELGGPHWIFAQHAYDVDPQGSGDICVAFDKELGIISASGTYTAVETGYTRHSYIRYGNDGCIYCVAYSPTAFSVILRVHPHTKQVDILKVSQSLDIDRGYLSVPSAISWPTGQDEVSHGYFYPPKNKDYTAPDGELPPLLVKAHGGPTGATFPDMNLKIQYFTSRGFGVLDVNYRGSTGYGKTYRHKLRKNWGVYDVEDCCSGATYLAGTKKVDGDRLCIDGGSAGGYTTLACLAFRDNFKAGASHYGIGDLEVLMKETHKFESRYLDNLLLPYKPENVWLLHERSPMKHIDRFSCPVVFFQGDEDKIVPPNQAEMMYNAVKAKGLPCAFVLFEGEQHGFRKSENIQKALDGEFYFFAKVFGFEPADKNTELEIANL